jgi:colanic acid/amylovoran biosynthesis glycosyltransferase
MKIAYLTSEYPAPSHTFIRREVAALREAGVEIETYSVRRPKSTARFSSEDLEAQAETRYVLDSRGAMALSLAWAFFTTPLRSLSTLGLAIRHRVPGLRALVWAILHFVEAIHLARMLYGREVGHVHNHFANSSAIVGMLAAHHLGLGFSLTIHGISEFDGSAGGLLPKKIRACRFVACVSSFGRAQVMRLVEPAEWPKLFISRCGLHTSARPRRVGAIGRLRFCSVGRLSPEKGQAGLLEAFRITLESGVDAELHLVGDGPLRSELERKASELGVGARTIFHGQLTDDEVASIMSATDVFVMSSFMEGLPVVIMEAFAAGVPVIAPGVAGIPELVVHHETGLLFPPSDWDALAESMTQLAANPGLCARIGERGRRKVIEQHEISRAVLPLLRQFAASGLVHLDPSAAEWTGKKRRLEPELDALKNEPVPGTL